MKSEWVHVLIWVLSGLMSLIVLFGGAYMRKLSSDISKVEMSHATALSQIQANCHAEILRQAGLAERLAGLETGHAAMKEDLSYIRSRVDEIAACLAKVASQKGSFK